MGLPATGRWLVLLPDGTALTARDEHRMLGITATPDGEAIVLADRDGGDVARRAAGRRRVGADDAVARRARATRGRCGRRWLSERLGTAVRLGWLDDPRRRSVAESHGGRPGDVLSFADAGPLLLASTASLRRLTTGSPRAQSSAARSCPRRCRWSASARRSSSTAPTSRSPRTAGAASRSARSSFRFAEHCDRCVLTTVDTRDARRRQGAAAHAGPAPAVGSQDVVRRPPRPGDDRRRARRRSGRRALGRGAAR